MQPHYQTPPRTNDTNAHTELRKKVQKGVIVFWRGRRDYSSSDPRATPNPGQLRWSKPAIIDSVLPDGTFTIVTLDDNEKSERSIYAFRKVNTNIYTADISKEVEYDQILFPKTEDVEKKWIASFIKDKGELALQDINIFIYMKRYQWSPSTLLDNLIVPASISSGNFFYYKKIPLTRSRIS